MCCVLGSISDKEPLKNIEIIAPNIYVIDIGGYYYFIAINDP